MAYGMVRRSDWVSFPFAFACAAACSSNGEKADSGGAGGALGDGAAEVSGDVPAGAAGGAGGALDAAAAEVSGDVPVEAPAPICVTAVAPGSCLLVLASQQTSPSGPALDGANVYWTQMLASNYALMRFSVNGGQATPVISSAARPVAIGGINVYLFSGNGVMPVPIGDGQTAIPFQGFGAALAADATNAYMSGVPVSMASALSIVPVGGGSATMIWAFAAGQISGVALDSTAVYWTYQGISLTDSSYNPPAVMKAGIHGDQPGALEGGGSELVLHGFGGASGAGGGGATGNDAGPASDGGSDSQAAPPYAPDTPLGIAVDATNLYWADAGSPGSMNGQIMKMPLTGGTPVVLASGLVGPATIAVDGASVYWTSSDGAIRKVSLSGGVVTTLASGRTAPHDVKVDATSLYWVEDGDAPDHGSVLKLTPK
jgi:hypothetical protein